MITIEEAVIVEGKYDKIRLSSFVDGLIIETGGFRIFKDREKRALIRTLGKKCGLLVLTDSDSAGFLIRNHLKGLVPSEQIRHAYIPEILGKEKRKGSPSKEGLLGVEGMPEEILRAALIRAGIHERIFPAAPLTKTDLFNAGLSGNPGSASKRKALLQTLGLPSYLSSNALLDILNFTMDPAEAQKLLDSVKE